MVLKKNQIPPNLNFINPKPSLHLNERGIKVSSSPFKFRGTSINRQSFAFKFLHRDLFFGIRAFVPNVLAVSYGALVAST
jgi:hypothetical protein